MEPAKSYIELIAHLKGRFAEDPNRSVGFLGLVFCRPELKLAREEIFPSMAYYDHRSGKNVDFYFAGFDKKPTPDCTTISIPTAIPSKPGWYFSLKSFEEFRFTIQEYTQWRYSGGCDFILVNCFYREDGEPWLDFDGAVFLTLENLRQQGRLPEVGIFFNSIFQHCEAARCGDQSWGLGHDAQPGSALMELSNTFLKQPADASPVHAVKTPDSTIAPSQKNQELIGGQFRYDIATKALIITPSGKQHIVDTRYAEVLSNMFKREKGLYAIRASRLSYQEVAILFQLGRWKEHNPTWNERDLKNKLKQNLSRIENQNKLIAQEFRRQFSKWLRKNGIAAGRVITADAKNMGYKLGIGWHSERMVINDSEAGLGYAGKRAEAYGESEEDNLGSMTPRHMGS